MGGGALGSKLRELVSKVDIVAAFAAVVSVGRAFQPNNETCHLERSERSQKHEILRLTPQNDDIFSLAPWGEGLRERGQDLTSTTEISQLDCHVADAPRNDGNRHPELVVSGSQNDTVFSHFTSHFSRKRVAFTLAEVLITLGIIGVVAALTLPSVIHKYKIKQLHTAFLRSSSMIQNALNEVAYDYGYNNFKAFNEICGNLSKQDNSSCRNSNATLFAEISSDFISKFKVVRKMDRLQFNKPQFMTTDYSGNYHVLYKELYGITNFATPHAAGYLLPDGTLVSAISFFYHEPSDGLTLTFDTNGPFKGPNRYGYDIFVFNTGTWGKICTKNGSGSIFNGRGCYDYALKDVNPDDRTKGYWDSL